MPKAATFHCTVITPERKVLECEAKFAAFPAHDGEMGVLPRRAPLVCKLGIGLLRVESLDQTHVLLVDEGFAQVVGNRLTILTERAKRAGEVELRAAEAAAAQARSLRITDEATLTARSKALQRAKTLLKLFHTTSAASRG